jgi:TRAP-type C4-dicarboxylate transport system permease small subunit
MNDSTSKGSGFYRFLEKFQALYLRFNTWVTLLGSIWLFLVMFQVTGDVTGRYLFLSPIPGTTVLSVIMLVFVVYLGAAYTEIKAGHIRVDMIAERFPMRSRKILNIIWTILGLSILPLFTWQTFILAMRSWQNNEVSIEFPIGLYYGKFAMSAGFFLLTIQFILHLLLQLFGSRAPEKPAATKPVEEANIAAE